jgi:steroid delta-isomerase-like uncharacterized protein
MSAENKATARRFFEEILGQGNWAAAGEVLSPDVVMHHPSSPEPVRSREAVQGFLSAFRAGFPDMRMSVLDAVAEDDKVVILWQMQGTQTAELFGIPPTGKAVKVRGMSLLRLADGKVVENTVSEDTMGLMQQLGLVPTPGS